MSEQPERSEIWTTQNPDGSLNVHANEAEAVQVAADVARACGDVIPILRHVELREGETIVGPLERAVIEAAINHQKIADAFKAEDDEDILCALAKKSTAAQRTLEAAVRALREARR